MSNGALFLQCADAFVDVVRRIPDESWELEGLGQWSVRSLVGHTTRAILTVEQYLHLDDPGDVTVPTAVQYYTTVYEQFTDPAAVHDRGVEAGAWLGEEPLLRITDAIGRARAQLDQAPDNRVVSIGGMGIPLPEYLRTRILELTVHTSDIARAVGIGHRVPDEAIGSSTMLATATAIAKGDGEALLLALTGRTTLPGGLSVV